jgi:hypothetical protein
MYVGQVPSRPKRPPYPAACLRDGETWPDGKLKRDAPPEAKVSASISRRLREAMGDRSARDVARSASISPQTVLNLLNGRSWGDVLTVARLERALNVTLWVSGHAQ